MATFGPNAVRSHHTSALSVLVRQVNSPLLWLLLAAAAVSAFVGEGVDAAIIGVILAASVGLGFVNEYRAERAAEAMHSEIRHLVTVVRDGEPTSVEVTHLVPGDLVHLDVGSIVPADLRLLTASNLECDESILTGESVPAEKSPTRWTPARRLAELSSCLFMGTVVHEGSADAVVVATGRSTAVRTHRRRSRRAPPPDRVPDRADPLLRAARQGRRRAERDDLRRQRAARADR